MASVGLFILFTLIFYVAIYLAKRKPGNNNDNAGDLLPRNGLEVKLFQLKYYTTSFNRPFSRLGTWKPGLLDRWFTAGAVISALLLIPSLVLLVKTLIGACFGGGSAPVNGDNNDRFVLQPVLPGVNMPLTEFGYYFLALLLCSILHEAGHAVAAVNEDIKVLGSGLFVLFVLPAAFVDLPTDQLLAVRPFQQLKVFAAGIWHNVVLALIAYGVFFSTPVLVSPAFESDSGVSLSWVKPDSAVKGPTGLREGDFVTLVNDCPVKNVADWRNCLAKAILEPDLGVCAESLEKIQDLEKNRECCDKESEISSADSLCFRGEKRLFCLPVRKTLEESAGFCSKDDDVGEKCGFCLYPRLESNSSRLLKIRREKAKDFLFVGSPAEVYHSAKVSDYRSKWTWLSPEWPNRIELLAYYIASFSGALAVLNVVPCFMLDGQHMIRVLVELLCPSFETRVKQTMILSFTIIGSLLIIVNLVVGICSLL